jgi:hypothetical protein
MCAANGSTAHVQAGYLLGCGHHRAGNLRTRYLRSGYLRSGYLRSGYLCAGDMPA